MHVVEADDGALAAVLCGEGENVCAGAHLEQVAAAVAAARSVSRARATSPARAPAADRLRHRRVQPARQTQPAPELRAPPYTSTTTGSTIGRRLILS